MYCYSTVLIHQVHVLFALFRLQMNTEVCTKSHYIIWMYNGMLLNIYAIMLPLEFMLIFYTYNEVTMTYICYYASSFCLF